VGPDHVAPAGRACRSTSASSSASSRSGLPVQFDRPAPRHLGSDRSNAIRARAVCRSAATAQFYYNLEIEFPIVQEVGIRGVVFTDGGNAWNLSAQYCNAAPAPGGLSANDPCQVNPFDIRTSWGFGIRWVSPLGPLRFEWGIPFVRSEALSEQSRPPFDQELLQAGFAPSRLRLRRKASCCPCGPETPGPPHGLNRRRAVGVLRPRYGLTASFNGGSTPSAFPCEAIVSMQVSRHAVTLVAALLLGAIAPKLYAQTTRIAVVDLQRALNETEDGRRAKAKLKKLFKRRQQTLDKRQRNQALLEDRGAAEGAQPRRVQKRVEEYQKAFIGFSRPTSVARAGAGGGAHARIIGRMERILETDRPGRGLHADPQAQRGGDVWVRRTSMSPSGDQRYNAGEVAPRAPRRPATTTCSTTTKRAPPSSLDCRPSLQDTRLNGRTPESRLKSRRTSNGCSVVRRGGGHVVAAMDDINRILRISASLAVRADRSRGGARSAPERARGEVRHVQRAVLPRALPRRPDLSRRPYPRGARAARGRARVRVGPLRQRAEGHVLPRRGEAVPRPVVPGDKMVLDVEVVQHRSNIWKVAARWASTGRLRDRDSDR
jgi:hypothetical protein